MRSGLQLLISRKIAQFGAWLRQPAATGLFATALIAAIVLPARSLGLMQQFEMEAYDRFAGLRADGEGFDPRVVQLSVTEADIERFGWPLPDGEIADIIERLHSAHPRAIGIDIFRPTPVGAGSERLLAALRNVPEVIWADRFSEGGWSGIAAPEGVGARNGFADVLLDAGGVARRGLLFLDDGRVAESAFSLRLALLYLRAEGVRPRADPGGDYMLGLIALPPLDRDLGGYRSIDTRGYQILREFRAPAHLRVFTLSDLVDGRVSPETVAGRIVVVGIVSDTVKDTVLAPVSSDGPVAMPGVTLQGLFAAQLVAHGLDGLPRTRALSRLGEFALLLGLVIGGGLVAMLVASLRSIAAFAGGGAAAILGFGYFAFTQAVWLPAMTMAACWSLAIVIGKTSMAQMEASQRAVLMRMFSTHMAAPIAAEMWRRRRDFVRLGRPLPVKLSATVLFSDVNDFTSISERMTPEKIVEWLEPYMIAMTRLVDEHGGVVERFSGDGILAMFGVPVKRETPGEVAADARAAVRCAQAMARAITALNQSYRAKGQPEIAFAVGIQSGDLVGCCLGSDERQQYTTMGDTTNTAARLVNTAKEVMQRPGTDSPCCIVIGDVTRDLVGEAFRLRPLGAVELKGKQRRTEAFAVDQDSATVTAFPLPRKYG